MALDLIVRHSADADAMELCKRSGATDRAAINAFVRGVKDFALWESMVCWPLRSSQNAGNGNTVYSLGGLGTYNGTLVNDPAWTADGINFSLQSQRITTSYNAALTDMAALCVYKTTADLDNFGRLLDKNFNGGMWMGRNGTAADLFGGTIAEYSIGGSQFVTLADQQRHFLLMTRSGTTHSVFGDGGAVSNVATKSSTATTADNFTIGLINQTQRGTTSLAAIFNVAVSSAQNASLYALYKQTLGAGLGLPDYDPATIEFANRSGATDLANIDAFVRGVKDLGLWDNMVCWPLRSSQNAGSGNTVHSLGGLGTYNGTRVGGPAWGASGIEFSDVAHQITRSGFDTPASPMTFGMVSDKSDTAAQIRLNSLGVFPKRYVGADAINTRSLDIRNNNNSQIYIWSPSVSTDFIYKSASITGNLTADGYVNGVGVSPTLTNVGATGWDDSAGDSTQLIYASAGSDATIRAAFYYVLSGVAATAAQQSALYTLYRNTLGTGLGLP